MFFQVNLGIIDEPSGTSCKTTHIMEKLMQYVPLQTETSRFTILCHGNQLAVERTLDAKQERAKNCAADGKFDGLEPMPQELHKRHVLLQVFFSCHMQRLRLFRFIQNLQRFILYKFWVNC